MEDALKLLPAAEESDKEEIGESLVKHLRDEVEVTDKRRLQDDGHIGSVEELDGVVDGLAAVAFASDGKVNTEALHDTVWVKHDVEKGEGKCETGFG